MNIYPFKSLTSKKTQFYFKLLFQITAFHTINIPIRLIYVIYEAVWSQWLRRQPINQKVVGSIPTTAVKLAISGTKH